MKPNILIGEDSKNELNKLNVKDFDFFMRKLEYDKNSHLSNLNELFDHIYVLILNSMDSFFSIEVYWKEIFINSDLKELELIQN